jgi:hypothetical protein
MCFPLCPLDYLTDVSSEQHSSAQTQGLQILPEVLELEIPTEVSVILVQMLVCSNFSSGYLSEETTQKKGAGGFWTVEYYQPYFDVDTKTVRFQLFLDNYCNLRSYVLGPTEMLHNTHPNRITHLPFHTSQPCRSLRAILDSHNAHFRPFLVFVFGSLYCCIPFNGRRAV